MSNFYSRLSYSFGNEDWKTELKALRIQPKDRVLCVTASGDRPLNLLTQELNELVTIDSNPVQNALFSLKKTAMTHLSYAEYLAFLGVDFHESRLTVYHERLEKHLDETSANVWQQHKKKIARGVLYEGEVERSLKIAAKVLNLVRGKKIKKLFSYTDLSEQKQFLETHWHTFLWKKAFEVALHPKISRFLVNDPGLYAFVEPNVNIGKHLYERLHAALQGILAKESVLMNLLFKGRVGRDNLPPYLCQGDIPTIKKQLSRSRFQTADLCFFLETSPSDHYDCFSLSDVASYSNQKEFDRIIGGVFKTARKGARFCIRQFLSNHQVPERYASSFRRDKNLEETLEKEDRCLLYRFMVGTIQK